MKKTTCFFQINVLQYVCATDISIAYIFLNMMQFLYIFSDINITIPYFIVIYHHKNYNISFYPLSLFIVSIFFRFGCI